MPADLYHAIKLANKAHRDQYSRNGMRYIMHPLRMMLQLEDESEEAQIVAVLHDVVEDSEYTIDDLEAREFSPGVIAAVEILTRTKDQPYDDYIIGCSKDDLAAIVKIADLIDHLDPLNAEMWGDKLEDVTRRANRYTRYTLSLAFLQDRISKENYRAVMEPFRHSLTPKPLKNAPRAVAIDAPVPPSLAHA